MKILPLLMGLLVMMPRIATAAEPVSGPAAEMAPQSEATSASLRVPVEVVAKGGKPQWVMVQVETREIPEPSALTLLMASLALCMRRQRP